ncbi:MarR family transcriptional regulator [Nostocoides sp. F2B08]|uniref:MarR family winged helix-turn-helix transcriptional regulator n=1 Tax=Nostocoides sp. F2B08 TaxID=2653936 RepID=UPI0012633E8D|nr:MarR family transcriptional regulator [Tetrasphaera sp. F2B08]KAB7744221.1 MarR family transcriptional regulator [Tetrasphaera sp. F2B08]
MNVRDLDPTEAAAWRAMVVFWRLGLPKLERTFRRVGLSHLEYGFLAVLAEQPESAMPAGELADLAGISSSRLSHRLKGLEAAGDIARRPDQHDRRGVVVVLTDQGREKVERVYRQHLADVRNLVFDHLSAAQTKALQEVMTAIAGPLTSHAFLSATDER